MNKQDKELIVADLRDKFLRAKGVVLTEYKGLTVAEISALRDSLRKSAIEYRVVKNTLARIASEGTPCASAKAAFVGPMAVAIDYEDPARVAKAVLEFAKGNEKLKVVGGVVDGILYSAEQMKAVAKLPSREVLLGMLAGTLQAPATKMVRLMNATVVQFAYALQALRDKKAAA